MIIDTLQNASKYNAVHPLFEKAFEWIKATDLINAEVGTIQIAEGLKAIISNGQGKTKEDSLKKFECHDKNIDIQVCLSGHETIGWRSRKDCTKPNGEYNTEKDVQFFHDGPDTYFQLKANQFAIFFPDDVHAPMIGDGVIRKLVIKVAI
mgnify:CR=1 FL=1